MGVVRHPPKIHLKGTFHANMVYYFPITANYVDNIYKIFGSNLIGIRGKRVVKDKMYKHIMRSYHIIY